MSKAFESIKEKLITTPILQGPNWNIPLHINTNASDKEIGEFLGQNEDKKPYAICFIRKKLSSVELNYTMTEKESLVVAYFLNKIKHYVVGYKFFVCIDHSSIRYLMKKT
jgi:hypothetical protein